MTFADVAGIEEAKDEVEEIIAFLKDPKKFTRLGGRIPKGVLMMGPPGTGKTLLARAIAGEAGVPFFSISGSDFVEMFVGVGASRVRDLFEQGKKNAPCIIFIDEIDAVGRHRGAGLGGGHDEREQTLNQLLVEMDGFESNEGVIIIAATNRPDVLDPALLRPGRFDRRIVVPRPDVRGRARHPQGPHQEGAARRRTSTWTSSPAARRASSGADLENLVNEAALLAARAGQGRSSSMSDFEMAKDKVLMGAERRSMIISDKEKRNTAFHEAGHALVGKLMKDYDPVHKVTIIPRGRALGVTQQLPAEDRLSLSADAANDQIAMMMGGRTGRGGGLRPDHDRRRPTTSSRPRTWRAGWCASGACRRSSGRCTSASARARSSSAATSATPARTTASRPRSRSTPRSAASSSTNYDRAKKVILENLDKLKALAEALLEHETIDGAEIDIIFSGQKLERKVADCREGDAGAQGRREAAAAEHLRAAAARARQGLVRAAARPGRRGASNRSSERSRLGAARVPPSPESGRAGVVASGQVAAPERSRS